jgi:hypothetical protein
MTAHTHGEVGLMGWSARWGATLLAGACICLLTVRVEAQEFCVSCAEPAAVYRCVIDGAQPGGSQPLQVLCITAMAKEGHHASCSLKRGTVFDCNGPVKRVSWSAYNPGVPAAMPPAASAEKGAPKQGAAAPRAKPGDPPQTVEEMAKRAGGQAGDQVKSVGQKMGEATKKTWNCIVSLLTRCGE